MLYSNLKKLCVLLVCLSCCTVAWASSASSAALADSVTRQSQALLNQLFQTASSPTRKQINPPTIQLYYFLSFSMPPHLIQSYLSDALKDGGTIVFRGVEKDQSLQQFLLKNLFPLIPSKGPHAPVEIDPNKFEAYQVKAVPTIVLAVDKNRYWTISGSVSSHYALEQFLENGAPVEGVLLNLKNQNSNLEGGDS